MSTRGCRALARGPRRTKKHITISSILSNRPWVAGSSATETAAVTAVLLAASSSPSSPPHAPRRSGWL
eukprot:4244485-Lingulodinium_polyedra.AAC.1